MEALRFLRRECHVLIGHTPRELVACVHVFNITWAIKNIAIKREGKGGKSASESSIVLVGVQLISTRCGVWRLNCRGMYALGEVRIECFGLALLPYIILVRARITAWCKGTYPELWRQGARDLRRLSPFRCT